MITPKKAGNKREVESLSKKRLLNSFDLLQIWNHFLYKDNMIIMKNAVPPEPRWDSYPIHHISNLVMANNATPVMRINT